ncbi:hypothetical protein Trydic_g8049 [Trypoxylus dichotomus]
MRDWRRSVRGECVAYTTLCSFWDEGLVGEERVFGTGKPSIKDHSKILNHTTPFDLRSGDGDLLLQLLIRPSERNRLRLPRIDLEAPCVEGPFDFHRLGDMTNHEPTLRCERNSAAPHC